jgi:hypothetical protein
MSMTATITATEPANIQTVNVGRLLVTGKEAPFNDWRDELVRDGYAVVKGAIPKDRTDAYVDELHSWLEDLCVTCPTSLFCLADGRF